MALSDIAIIGPGAVGVMLGAELLKLGHRPTYIGRHGPVAVDARIDLRDLKGQTDQRRVATKEGEGLATAAAVFVTVKAFDLAAALAQVRHVPVKIPVITVVNGAIEGVVSQAAGRDPQRVYRLGICTIGISALGDARFEVRSNGGEVGFGPSDGTSDAPMPIEHELTAHRPFKWHTQAVWAVRRKWLYNTVINSLTAARHMATNGALLGDMPTLVAAFDEAYRLGQSLWGAWPLARAELYAGLVALVEATAGNENSMARDVRLGRPTESAFLAGMATLPAFPILHKLHRTLVGETS